MNVPPVRWLGRFIEERRPTLAEIALASTALAEVGGTGDASLRPSSQAPSATVCLGEEVVRVLCVRDASIERVVRVRLSLYDGIPLA